MKKLSRFALVTFRLIINLANMRFMKTNVVVAILLLLVNSQAVLSQQVVVSLPSSLSAMPGTEVQIPITVTDMDTVCNISLVFTYDTNVLQYLGYISSPILSPFQTLNHYKNQIRYGWYSLAGAIMPDNEWLFKVRFKYIDGTSPLNWVTSQGSCVIGNCQIGAKPATFINGDLSPVPHGVISGILTYDNNIQSVLPHVLITLKNANGNAVDTVLTNDQGSYTFYVTETGTYSLSLAPPQPWGGVNSIDALKVIKHYVGTELLTGLATKAADVNNNNYVNSSDALLILKRFVGMQNTFPAGDWTYDNPVINMSSFTQQTINIKALCVGDVDRSYLP